VLAQDERSPLCIKIEKEGHLTPDQANNTVGPWAKRQYDEYVQWNKTGAGDEFWNWLHKRWAPDAAGSISECKQSSTCSVVSCRLISNKYDLQDQWSAYWTLESIAIFHNMAYEIRKANEEAWLSVHSDVATLVARFSDGSNIEAHKAQHDQHWKIASHVICGVAVLTAAIGVFLGAVITVAPLATEELVKATMTADEIRMIAASASLFNSGASTALSFGTDVMGPKDYVSKITNTLEASQKQNQVQIMDRFDAYIDGLFSGHDPSLIQLVQKGGYIKSSRVLTPEHNKKLRERWAAAYISSIWNLERTYIVMSNTGDCESDSRGFKGLRVCLEEAPGYVFYAFSKSIVREETNHKALIRGPIGHSNLKSFTGFTLEDVVRASFVYFKRNGYSVSTGAPEGSEDIVNSFFGPAGEAGGKAHGLFNIPILYSPGGQAISSINTRDNRNYPCMAAKLPWSENNDQLPRSLQGQDNDMGWTENHPETMFKFLNATGLYRSGDWWGYCHGSREHHGNHCKGNKDINWKGKFGPDQYHKIQHPFKHCKARKGHGNGFVGCERPHNNGYDKNKPGDCGGKQVIAGDVSEGDSRWFNGKGFEADVAEDEGDMTDWSDGEEEGDEDADERDETSLRTSRDNKTGIASRFYA
jgi:hypothetical protein